VGHLSFPPLAAGASTTMDGSVFAGALSPGSHTLWALADGHNTIAEANEGNNTASAPVSVRPPGPGGPDCPCSLWDSTTVPAEPAHDDPQAVELGVKFSADIDGFVTGIRFYKGAGNTGTHVGSLWTSTGTKLASATFTGESVSGWQQVSFSSPVAVTAGTTYVASYYAPVGRYSVDRDYFGHVGVDNTPLHAPAADVNGVYKYGASGFPTEVYQATNYWVDVVFVTSPSGTATPTQTLTPTATPNPAANCPCSIWGPTATPAMAAQADSGSYELGVKLRADASGYVTGIRFYKGAGNTGAHVGSLWTSTGTKLASATFTGESASGWQQVSFSSPVAITAGTTYVASYYAPVGRYALNEGFFLNAGVDNGPLHALRNGIDGPNGVYKAGASGFPTQTYNGNNYWVDVVLTATPPVTASPSPTATSTLSVTPTPSATTIPTPRATATLTPSATATPAPGACPCSLWTASDTPVVAAQSDPQGANGIEVGVRLKADVNGTITGLRFYKGTANTGTHVGSIWTSGGQKLASATFSNETASGWQQVTFATPVQVQAGQTYVASYFSPAGRFALTEQYFATRGVDRGPLHAPQTGAGSPNGVYKYGPSSFPNQTYNGNNYWVDVVFNPS
jgi:hypothetical protein